MLRLGGSLNRQGGDYGSSLQSRAGSEAEDVASLRIMTRNPSWESETGHGWEGRVS